MKSRAGRLSISLLMTLAIIVSFATPVVAAELSEELNVTEEISISEEITDPDDDYELPFPLLTFGPVSKTKVYDGTPLVLTDDDWWFENLPSQVDSCVVFTNEAVCQITDPGVLNITESLWPYTGYALFDANGNNLTHQGYHHGQKFVPGTLTITKRSVTLTVEHQTMAAGDELPALTANFDGDGFLADDGYAYELYVDGDTSVPGTYPIRVAAGAEFTGRGENYYDILVEVGTMTVTDPLVGPNAPDPIVPPTPSPEVPTPDVVDSGYYPPAVVEPETELIEDTPTPLASFPSETIKPSASWALLNLIVAILALVFTVMLLIGFFRKNNKHLETSRSSDIGWRVFSMVVGILAPVVFVLTENIWNQMIFVDNWTLWMLVIFAVQLIGILLLHRTQSQEGASKKA